MRSTCSNRARESSSKTFAGQRKLCEYAPRSIQFHLYIFLRLFIRLGQESNHRESLCFFSTENIVYCVFICCVCYAVYAADRPLTSLPHNSTTNIPNPIITSEKRSLCCARAHPPPLRLLCGALIKSCFNGIDLFCNYPPDFIHSETSKSSVGCWASTASRERSRETAEKNICIEALPERCKNFQYVHC